MLMAVMMNSVTPNQSRGAGFNLGSAVVRHRGGFLPQIRSPSTLLGSHSKAQAATGMQ
jgi:hypothetical protein